MKVHDRRRSPRLFHSLKATIEHPSGYREVCSTIDLSATGALLDVGQNFSVGESFRVRFSIPTDSDFEVVSRVCRTASAFGGRRFVTALTFDVRQPELFAKVCAREHIREGAASVPA